MAAYCIFEVTFSERGWRREYVPPTLELIAKHGGKPLAGAEPEKLEGEGVEYDEENRKLVVHVDVPLTKEWEMKLV